MSELVGGAILTLLNDIDTVSKTFVFDGYQKLASSYTPAIIGLVILSVVLFGYALLHGWVELSMSEIGKRALVIGIVLMLALNWGKFSEYVYNVFAKGPNEISVHIMQAIPSSAIKDAGGANGALQRAWDNGMYYTSQAFSLVSWTNIPPFFCAIFIFVAVVILVGIALIELIVAKFGLAIFLVLAPLAIPTFLFKATKEMIGDGWLKHLITFAFIPIFITSAMALGLMLMVHVDDQMKHSVQVGTLVFSDICPYLIYSIACIGLLFKAATMAANIAGGFASSAANVFGHVGSKMLDGLKKLLKGNPNKAKGGKSGKSGKDNGTSQGNKPSNDPAPNTNNS